MEKENREDWLRMFDEWTINKKCPFIKVTFYFVYFYCESDGHRYLHFRKKANTKILLLSTVHKCLKQYLQTFMENTEVKLDSIIFLMEKWFNLVVS